MENKNEKQIQVIEAVKSYNPEFIRNCYAVGLWVWAEFKQRLNQQELSFLKEAGFRWNPRRKVWQNACGVKKRQSAGDPRSKYGVVRISED
jgi:hypothetical protein